MPAVDTDMYFKLVNDAFKQKEKLLKIIYVIMISIKLIKYLLKMILQ